MNQVNYIRHLNGVFVQFSKDNRLNPTHISLYMALFQLWNNNRFPDEFYINREEVMKFSRIGSKTTYHRCIKELTYWKYLVYYPSHNPFKGSRIRLFKFGTSDGQVMDLSHTNNETSSGQALVPYINNNKQIENYKNNNKLDQPKNENEVLAFFKKEKRPAVEAKKFYHHYQGIGWKVGGKTKIVDWQATARNWILKADEIKKQQKGAGLGQKRDNLNISTDKDYGTPL